MAASDHPDRLNREARRNLELQELTVSQVATRGDRLRLVCLDCGQRHEFPARDLVRQHGHKIVGTPKPRCSACQQSRRPGVGLHKPGCGTYIEILWPDDRP